LRWRRDGEPWLAGLVNTEVGACQSRRGATVREQ
jgi:hypothetical protein